jgi:hypothetical protein
MLAFGLFKKTCANVFLFKKLNLDGRQIFSEKIIINNVLPDIS